MVSRSARDRVLEVLLEPRAREEALIKLPEIESALKKAESEINNLVSERECLTVFIAEQCVELYMARVKLLKEKLDHIAIEIKQLEEQETEA